ncbi:superoxide dismutase, partial [Gymnopilus junonius]
MDPYKKSNSSFLRPFLFTLAFFATIFLGYRLLFQDTAITVNKAVVVFKGTSVTGTVTFKQSSPGASVKVSGNIQGLSSSALHGFHVHQSGDLSDGCLSAGPHFNPFAKTHGAPTASSRHVGDLGNIKTDESGVANFELSDDLLSLNGPNSIIGYGTDDLGLGGDEESLKTGNAGARSACGVI